MSKKNVLGWHLIRGKGELSHSGELAKRGCEDSQKPDDGVERCCLGAKMCCYGMHASRMLADAASFVSGPIVRRVELVKNSSFDYDERKMVSDTRRVIATLDITKLDGDDMLEFVLNELCGYNQIAAVQAVRFATQKIRDSLVDFVSNDLGIDKNVEAIIYSLGGLGVIVKKKIDAFSLFSELVRYLSDLDFERSVGKLILNKMNISNTTRWSNKRVQFVPDEQ